MSMVGLSKVWPFKNVWMVFNFFLKMIDQNQSTNGFWGKEKMKKLLHKLKEF